VFARSAPGRRGHSALPPRRTAILRTKAEFDRHARVIGTRRRRSCPSSPVAALFHLPQPHPRPRGPYLAEIARSTPAGFLTLASIAMPPRPRRSLLLSPAHTHRAPLDPHAMSPRQRALVAELGRVAAKGISRSRGPSKGGAIACYGDWGLATPA